MLKKNKSEINQKTEDQTSVEFYAEDVEEEYSGSDTGSEEVEEDIQETDTDSDEIEELEDHDESSSDEETETDIDIEAPEYGEEGSPVVEDSEVEIEPVEGF